MLKYSISKTLNCDRTKFYKIVASVEKYQHFLPWCIESYESNQKTETLKNIDLCKILLKKNINIESFKLKDTLEVKTFEGFLKVGFQILDFTYVSNVTCIHPNIIISEVDNNKSVVFQHLKSIWIIEKIRENLITVDYNIEMQFKYGFYSQFTHMFLDLLGESIVNSFVKEYENSNFEYKMSENINKEDKIFNIENGINNISNLAIYNKDLLRKFMSKLIYHKIANIKEIETLVHKISHDLTHLQRILFFSEINETNHNRSILEKIWDEIKIEIL